MIKYATYSIFQNMTTKEIVRIPMEDSSSLSKYANLTEWVLLTDEPEEESYETKVEFEH